MKQPEQLHPAEDEMTAKGIGTIERHITSLYRRIDVHRRSEATAYAMRHGLVSPDAREQ